MWNSKSFVISFDMFVLATTKNVLVEPELLTDGSKS